MVRGYEFVDIFLNELEVLSVELLIGNDYYSDLVLLERKKVRFGLYLFGFYLGWIFFGWLLIEEIKMLEVLMFFMVGIYCNFY